MTSFRYRCEGVIYAFDWGKVFSNFIAGTVMLQIAQAVAIAYALTFHPKAQMLKNATYSRFDAADGLGIIGLKGALAALQFERLDPRNTDQVTLAGLVSAYARINSMTFERAYAAAHLVMDLAKRGQNNNSTYTWTSSLSALVGAFSSKSIVEAAPAA